MAPEKRTCIPGEGEPVGTGTSMEPLGLYFLCEAGSLALNYPEAARRDGARLLSRMAVHCMYIHAITESSTAGPGLLITVPHTLLSAEGMVIAKSSSGWMKQAVLSALGMCVTYPADVGSSTPMGRSCAGSRSLAKLRTKSHN